MFDITFQNGDIYLEFSIFKVQDVERKKDCTRDVKECSVQRSEMAGPFNIGDTILNTISTVLYLQHIYDFDTYNRLLKISFNAY